MSIVVCLTYNPFMENTYLVYDDTKECIIFDPGCYTKEEKRHLSQQIREMELKPVRLINTHCHIDHVFGNKYVCDTYGLDLEMHKGEIPVLQAVPQVCQLYGIPNYEPSPEPKIYLDEGDEIRFGNTVLKAIFTPGHSPASLSFYNEEEGYLIAGDVLFRESIGRTDLPGGDHATLINSIKDKLLTLGDEVRVYPGHGEDTTIGYEKVHNPFL
jgi:hydroxyacylglutathione hydrolase